MEPIYTKNIQLKCIGKNTLQVHGFNNNFIVYCTDRDPWVKLKLSRLIITDNNDKITKRQLADLYYHEYIREVSDDTERDEGIQIKFKYNKAAKFGNTRKLFV